MLSFYLNSTDNLIVSGISTDIKEFDKVLNILRIDILIIICHNITFLETIREKISDSDLNKNILLILSKKILTKNPQLKLSPTCQIITPSDVVSVLEEKISMLTNNPPKITKIKNYNILNTITPREKEILHLIRKGKKNKEIASELFLSSKTIENHRNNIIKKTKSKSMLTLINELYKLGFFEF